MLQVKTFRKTCNPQPCLRPPNPPEGGLKTICIKNPLLGGVGGGFEFYDYDKI